MENEFDHYLSYWLLVWAFVYILLNWCFQRRRLNQGVFLGMECRRGITQNTYIDFFIRNCNPLIILVIALGVSIYALIVLIQKRAKPIIIFLYVLIILFKAIPIYFLMKFVIRPIPNIASMAVVIIIYELYLQSIGHDILTLYKNELKNIMEGKTPFIHLILYHLLK